MEDRNKKANILCAISIVLCIVSLILLFFNEPVLGELKGAISNEIVDILIKITYFTVPVLYISSMIIICYAKFTFKEHTLSNVTFWCMVVLTIMLIVSFILLFMVIKALSMACNGCFDMTFGLFEDCPG